MDVGTSFYLAKLMYPITSFPLLTRLRKLRESESDHVENNHLNAATAVDE